MHLVDASSRRRWAALAAAGLLAASIATIGAPAAANAAHAAKPKPKPTVTSVFNNAIHAPSAAIAGGARVTVTGAHFKNVQKVTFGKLVGKKLHVIGPHKLQVSVPPHDPGLVHVRVVTKAGKSTVNPHDRFYFQIRHRLAGGYEHSCQALASGIARCWGANAGGQLGDGTTTDRFTPVQVSTPAHIVAVATGDAHSCALTAAGAVKCWGDNSYGQLGDNTTTGRSTPVQVLGLGTAVAVSAGLDFTCALVVGGHVKCWGQDIHGGLGDGTTTDSGTPVMVRNLKNAIDVDAGGYHACALKADGTAWCWGYNNEGQLGNGTTTTSLVPTQVSALHHALSIATGTYTSCALTQARKVVCWGYGSDGERGDGTTTETVTRPTAVSGLSNVTKLAYATFHGCVIVGTGNVRCWGYNEYGEIGDGTSGGDAEALTPHAVAGLHHVVDIGEGTEHSLAVLKSGVTKAWGWNSHGQLGNNSTTDSSTPVTVS
jgi:alpha-tubulin suppressor-like RCC1 family protein